jgi:hypothetical protein
MAITARLDLATGVIWVMVTGGFPSFDDVLELRRKIAEWDDVITNRHVMADLRGMDGDALPSLEQLQQALGTASPAPGRRYAVVTTVSRHGLACAIETVAPPHLDIRAFTSEAVALDWLLSSATPR